MRAGLVAILAFAACGGTSAPGPAASPLASAAPSRPAGCRELPAGGALQAALAAAAPGESLCLAPGVHHGPAIITTRVSLWGPRAAVVAGAGDGTTLRVRAAGTALAGFTVDGSGARYDLLDAAVAVEADDVEVRGLEIRGAVYGILVSRARRVSVAHNLVRGDAREALGLRGDAIRLWEVTDSEVIGNDVEDGRDVVVWYSSRNRLAGNRVVGGRYGAHFMYSHDGVVEDNVFVRDVVGVFVMYSRNVTLRRNLIAEMHGAAGMGIGLKDSGNVIAEDNRIVRATTGIFLDASPSQITDHNVVSRNQVRWCGVGVMLHSSAERNRFADNVFAGNGAQVAVDGGGHGRAIEWIGNHFDDYSGYDLDGDGRGDVPYELRSIADELTRTHPQLALYSGTPALGLVEVVGRLVPLNPPTTILIDPSPRMEAR
jgi:nitrous oxidase accessory protein